MSPLTTEYPIIPTDEEACQLDKWCSKVSENLELAKIEWQDYRAAVATQTNTRLNFGWNAIKDVFWPFLDPERAHLVKSVLLVAWRFNWNPNEILALWQIEGLPAFRDLEKKGVTWDPLPIYDHDLPNPYTKTQALAMARSIVLYERWGLDKLTPHRPDHGDNVLLRVRNTNIHDKRFQTGFEQEISSILATSPLDYLKSSTNTNEGPIRVKRRWNNYGPWIFCTDSEYQTTMLALQFARFKNLEQKIKNDYMQESIQLRRCKGRKISLDLNFPAFVRTFYNCPRDPARKRLIRVISQLIRKSLPENASACWRWANSKYDREELLKLFISTPIPAPLLAHIQSSPPRGIGVCYLGGLRFEVLRHTYETIFTGTLI